MKVFAINAASVASRKIIAKVRKELSPSLRKSISMTILAIR